jgi:hypothetical protein
MFKAALQKAIFKKAKNNDYGLKRCLNFLQLR